MDGIGTFIGDLFKHFPVAAFVILIGIIYTLWYATGGVERGEERRREGASGLFIEVTGVPSQYESEEVFGSWSDNN